jgi:hypothetical protein
MARCPLHDLPIRDNECEECVEIVKSGDPVQ